jgi:hypothetical protein
VALVASAVTLAVSPARAEPTAPQASINAVDVESEVPQKRWYGWQILLAGGGMEGLAYLGFALRSDPILWAGFTLAPFGGPAVHEAHHQHSTAMVSFGMGVGLSVAGGFMGTAVGCSKGRAENLCGVGGVLWGALIGEQVATVVDAFAFGWARPRQAWARPSRLQVAPTFAILPGGGTLGVSASF